MKLTVWGNLGALITKMRFILRPHVSMATILAIKDCNFSKITLKRHWLFKKHTE